MTSLAFISAVQSNVLCTTNIFKALYIPNSLVLEVERPVEPVIFRFHRKPKLEFETELPVSTYL